MRVPHRLGRRGASLIIYGLVYMFSGVSTLTEINHGLPFAPFALPIWCGIFVVAGLLAVTMAFQRSPHVDRIGWVALAACGTGWVMYCVSLIILHFVLHGVRVAPTSILPVLASNAVTVSIVTVKVLIDAGWNEPPTPLPEELHGLIRDIRRNAVNDDIDRYEERQDNGNENETK